MWYMPYLRVRRAVQIYASIVVGFSLVAIALRYWPGALHLNAHDVRAAGTDVSLSSLIAGAAALVGGLATVLGLNLAAENDGHLEVAWTKPVSREGYALGVFAVDIGAMLTCIVLTVVCAVLVLDADLGRQAIILGSGTDALKTAAFCGFPLCVYAWITALSASLRGGRGTVSGIFWPLMLALVIVAALVHIPAVQLVTNVLNAVNPLELYSLTSQGPRPSVWLALWGWGVSAALLAAAMLQWRRLQA